MKFVAIGQNVYLVNQNYSDRIFVHMLNTWALEHIAQSILRIWFEKFSTRKRLFLKERDTERHREREMSASVTPML